ncbi:hypothetical protein [Streptomyces sp. NRRL S-646]|uniref:hypothetical protein n=1 Tax=Streptomyces sp. NRRL S-646 TaxID=1463917 RepID=UPI001F400A7C|nr:hypothetical protein [Streptomyces sp. NRRL S-646]
MSFQDSVDVKEAVAEEKGSRLRTGPPHGDAIVQSEDCPHILVEGEAEAIFQTLDPADRTTRSQGPMVSRSMLGQPIVEALPQLGKTRYSGSHEHFCTTWWLLRRKSGCWWRRWRWRRQDRAPAAARSVKSRTTSGHGVVRAAASSTDITVGKGFRPRGTKRTLCC